MDALYNLRIMVRLRDLLTGPAAGMRDAMQGIAAAAESAQRVKELGTTVATVGVALTAAGGAGLAALKKLSEPLAALEDEVANLRTVWTPTIGTMEESITKAVDAARQWARTHRETAAEFVSAAHMMGGAGLNDVQAIEGVRAALQLAAVTKGEAASAAGALASTYNNMGDTAADVAAEMNRLAQMLAKTQHYFQFADLNQLTEGMKGLSATANGAGVPLDQILATLGVLNGSFLQGAPAGTAAATALKQLSKAAQEFGFTIQRTADGGTDFIGTLAALRDRLGDVNNLTQAQTDKLAEVFGVGADAVGPLLRQLDKLQAGVTAVGDSGAVFATHMPNMLGTLNAQWDILKNNISDAALELAEMFRPQLEGLLEDVVSVARAFRDWAAAHPELAGGLLRIVFFGSLVAVTLGPLITLIGTLIAMMASVVLIAANWGAAAGTLSALLVTLRASVTALLLPFRLLAVALMSAGRAALSIVGHFVGGLATGLRYAAIWSGRLALAIGGKLVSALRLVGMVVMRHPLILLGVLVAAAVVWAIRNWDKLTAAVLTVLEALGAALDAAGRWFVEVWDGAVEAGSRWIEWLAGLPSRASNWVKNLIDRWMAGLADYVRLFYDAGASWATAIWDGLKSGWDAIASWFQARVNDLVDMVPESVVDFMEWLSGGRTVTLQIAPVLQAVRAATAATTSAPRPADLPVPAVTAGADRDTAQLIRPAARVELAVSQSVLERLAGARGDGTTTINVARMDVRAADPETFGKALKGAARGVG